MAIIICHFINTILKEKLRLWFVIWRISISLSAVVTSDSFLPSLAFLKGVASHKMPFCNSVRISLRRAVCCLASFRFTFRASTCFICNCSRSSFWAGCLAFSSWAAEFVSGFCVGWKIVRFYVATRPSFAGSRASGSYCKSDQNAESTVCYELVVGLGSRIA